MSCFLQPIPSLACLLKIQLMIWPEYVQEIVFACAKGVSLQLVQGQHLQQMRIVVAVLQIDNQLRHAVYPVLLSITNPKIDTMRDDAWIGADQMGEAALTFLVAKWRRPAGSVDCFQCINLRWVHMWPST